MKSRPVLLRKYPLLFDRLNRIARRLGRQSAFYKELVKHLPEGKPFTFLQIGANDGISHDPFREFMIRPEARGIAVEPVLEYFEQMVRNYAAYPNVKPENCGVGYPSGVLPFYVYHPDYLLRRGGSTELAGLAGFIRDHLMERLRPNDTPEQCIRQIEIPVRTVEELLDRHGLTSVDCLFLDCEGHEGSILQNMSYFAVNPRLIVFEHAHLGDQAGSVTDRLEREGYSLSSLEFDTVAVKRF